MKTKWIKTKGGKITLFDVMASNATRKYTMGKLEELYRFLSAVKEKRPS